jgi:hypothetical protein
LAETARAWPKLPADVRATILVIVRLDGLVDAVVHAPENADQFGTPPRPPLPIHLPRLT